MQALVSSTPSAELTDDPGVSAVLAVQSELIALALARGDTLLSANAAFRSLVGRSDDLAGTPVASLIAPAHHGRVAAMLHASGRWPAICIAETLRHDGRVVEVELCAREFVAGGEALRALFAQDVTDRSRVSAPVSLPGFSDPLTGLGNRPFFADRLRRAALASRREDGSFGLILLDLDGFRLVNDRYCRATGDAVLQQVAQRILGCLRAAETVARLGSDEFAVLIPGVKQPSDAAGVAERVLMAIRQPIAFGDRRLMLSATAGIAVFPEHGSAVEHLVAAAGKALGAAKRDGRGRSAWASARMPGDPTSSAILWSVAHEVGVPVMDAQHARMAGLLNALAAAFHDGRDHKAAFAEFTRYAAFHFASAERLMALTGYAGAAGHRDMHRQLLADVSRLAQQAEGIGASLIMPYLQEWLVRHLDGADRDLAAALADSNSLPP
jgi:diguanylate cyclase (GGDEF)-like protein/hemerythrin-like metal-binding protein